jgi:hypothetical protein
VPHSRDWRKAWWQHPPGQAAANNQIQDRLDNATAAAICEVAQHATREAAALQNCPLGNRSYRLAKQPASRMKGASGIVHIVENPR